MMTTTTTTTAGMTKPVTHPKTRIEGEYVNALDSVAQCMGVSAYVRV